MIISSRPPPNPLVPPGVEPICSLPEKLSDEILTLLIILAALPLI